MHGASKATSGNEKRVLADLALLSQPLDEEGVRIQLYFVAAPRATQIANSFLIQRPLLATQAAV